MYSIPWATSNIFQKGSKHRWRAKDSKAVHDLGSRILMDLLSFSIGPEYLSSCRERRGRIGILFRHRIRRFLKMVARTCASGTPTSAPLDRTPAEIEVTNDAIRTIYKGPTALL